MMPDQLIAAFRAYALTFPEAWIDESYRAVASKKLVQELDAASER